jgi:hypothetical protein
MERCNLLQNAHSCFDFGWKTTNQRIIEFDWRIRSVPLVRWWDGTVLICSKEHILPSISGGKQSTELCHYLRRVDFFCFCTWKNKWEYFFVSIGVTDAADPFRNLRIHQKSVRGALASRCFFLREDCPFTTLEKLDEWHMSPLLPDF